MFDKPSEEIKNRLDIVEVIQEYVQLKKVGQNWKACCPFHNEKTPSFMVSEDKQIWKCFGCNLGGDVFSFIMRIEGIEFIDALKILAQKAGVELKRQDPKIQTKRNRILEALDLAAKFFNKALFESKEGKIARDYLKKRKIEKITWDEFMIGYSPDSWDILTHFLKKKGFKDEEIVESGLVVRKDNGLGYYDRFRGRLMFPIWDVHGSVVGFGGRVLSGDEKQAKYINTPETFVYNKSRVLYGINKAKTDIRKEDKAIIVEGYTDVIASHEAGIKNVISASGTALTAEQIDLMKRYTNNIILSFDMDAAGDMATKRGIDMALHRGMNIKILELPSGKDPDECIREDVEAWRKAIDNAKSIMDYYFGNTLKGLDLNKVEDKKKAAALLLPQIKLIPDKIEQSHYLQKLASLIGVDEKILVDTMGRQEKKQNRYEYQEEDKSNNMIKESEDEILGRRLLSLFLVLSTQKDKKRLLEILSKEIKEQYLPENIIPLYTELINDYNNQRENFESEGFIKKLEKKNSEIAFMAKEFLLYFEKDYSEEILDLEELKKEIFLIVSRLKKIFLNKKLENIRKEMEKAERIGDRGKISELASEFGKISSQL